VKWQSRQPLDSAEWFHEVNTSRPPCTPSPAWRSSVAEEVSLPSILPSSQSIDEKVYGHSSSHLPFPTAGCGRTCLGQSFEGGGAIAGLLRTSASARRMAADVRLMDRPSGRTTSSPSKPVAMKASSSSSGHSTRQFHWANLVGHERGIKGGGRQRRYPAQHGAIQADRCIASSPHEGPQIQVGSRQSGDRLHRRWQGFAAGRVSAHGSTSAVPQLQRHLPDGKVLHKGPAETTRGGNGLARVADHGRAVFNATENPLNGQK
jgi:hypothetical protein